MKANCVIVLSETLFHGFRDQKVSQIADVFYVRDSEGWKVLLCVGNSPSMGIINRLIFVFIHSVPVNLPFDHIDYFFRNIGGMVCNSFKMAGN